MPRDQTSARHSELSGAKVLWFSVAGGIAVGNLYWSQPLLAAIAEAVRVSEARAGLLVTATQLGYALGILLLVPLGDAVNRRILIPVAMTCAAIALASAGLAPNYASLLIALACVGVLTTGGQMLPPLASDLSRPEDRGRVVGTISAGMLTGILLSRSISGVVADLAGWRTVFVMAAAASLVMALVLRRIIPDLPTRQPISYGALLSSMISIVREHPQVRATLLIGAGAFGAFTCVSAGRNLPKSAG